MPVYWSMLAVTSVLGYFSYFGRHRKIELEGETQYRTRLWYVVLSVAYILFFVGFRDYVMDTHAYVQTFDSLPNHWNDLQSYLSELDSDWGYYFLAGIFKMFISQNHYAWFWFLGSVSCIFLFRFLYKYSTDFPMTMYLFVAGTTFTWLINGARQFLAVCILTGFADWLIKGKKLRYCMLALLVSTIHSSAIFMIPVSLFVSSKKILGKGMVLFGILTVIGINYSESVFTFLESAMDMDYSEALASGEGSGVMRLIVACVPLAITLAAKRCVCNKATPSICLAVNMSFVADCFYLASTFTNGILVGRMPAYFAIYNLILLPWLLEKCFSRDSQKIMKALCIALYLYYFYYQMVAAWGGLDYGSQILHLYV